MEEEFIFFLASLLELGHFFFFSSQIGIYVIVDSLGSQVSRLGLSYMIGFPGFPDC
jgi:hypothetical protein